MNNTSATDTGDNGGFCRLLHKVQAGCESTDAPRKKKAYKPSTGKPVQT
jgi:hypothetical protein